MLVSRETYALHNLRGTDMEPRYKPYVERIPDLQYQAALRSTLLSGFVPGGQGEYVKNEFQKVGRYSNFGMFRLDYFFENGFPIITERKIGFWRKFINEMWAFMNCT